MKHLFWFLFITSCSVSTTDNSEKANTITIDPEIPETLSVASTVRSMSDTTPRSSIVHEISDKTESLLAVHNDDCKCPVQFELADSQQLTHIKHGFYKSKTGHLYNKTTGHKEINDDLVAFDYFNGHFSQEVDPLTFRELDGWYAVDKHNVYYYRAVSGGMQIFKMDEADVKTFKILKGHYCYAQDKNHFYDRTSIIENYNPQTTTCQRDERGKPISLSNKTGIYHLD
jgi:hypothetical protein